MFCDHWNGKKYSQSKKAKYFSPNVVAKGCLISAGVITMTLVTIGVFTLSVALCRQRQATTDRIVSNFVARHSATKSDTIS
jgi:hypothetical protein